MTPHELADIRAEIERAAAQLGATAEEAQQASFRAPHERDERGWCFRTCRACRLAARARLFTKAETSARFLAREGRG